MEKVKRKRKNEQKTSNSKYDIKRMMEEREEFYRGLKEIEELKKSLEEIEAEDEAREQEEALIAEATKKDVMSTLRLTGDKPPGREVVFPANHCQCFHKSKIEKLQLPGLTYLELRKLLENRIEINHVITNEALFSLFLLMSLDQNEAVLDSCYRLLKSHVFTFVPKFRHIINVFLNWGATCESLNVSEGEKSSVYPKGIRFKTPRSDYTFCSSNYSKVFDYVGEVCFHNSQCYSKTEKAILLKCLFRISLDKTYADVRASISSCISRVIESFPQWDDFTVANLCRLIHDEKDHFHNQVTVIMNTLPQINRCNDLLSCIYYYVLCSLVKKTPKYEFPYDDEDIVDLVKVIQVDPNDADDLYNLYVFVQLLNYIVYHRAIYKNANALQQINVKLDELKWAVARSTRMYDAAFVKGRIMYCSAMWSLSRPLYER